MSNSAVVAEIARLESEIGRIQRELDALKRSLGVPETRRTQAFPSVDATRSKHSTTRELPQPPMATPQPSVPLASETVPTNGSRSKSDRRVQQGGRTGLTDFPPPNANPTPSRRTANVDPAAGRYEYVGEGRSKTRR